jgi:hypothetical protein
VKKRIMKKDHAAARQRDDSLTSNDGVRAHGVTLRGGVTPHSAVIIVLYITLVIAAVLFFSRCELYGKPGSGDTLTEGALPAGLLGRWAFPLAEPHSELYTITAGSVEYGYGDGASPMDYKGAIRFVSNFSAVSGVIIIEYEAGRKPSYELHNGNDFFAVYYNDLHEDWLRLANAINPDGWSSPDAATLEDAKAKFTRGKMGNYVNWGLVQPQRRIK